MRPPILMFFNRHDGTERTSLVVHLAWMYGELGLRVLAADLDPMAHLTVAFLGEETLEELWSNLDGFGTVYSCIRPLFEGTGDIGQVHTEILSDSIQLIPGDLGLSGIEDELGQQWSQCLEGRPRAFQIVTALWQVLLKGAAESHADVVLVDVGPSSNAILRAALIAADHVVVPLSPSLFSIQALEALGPTLRRWNKEWQERILRNPAPSSLTLPAGQMRPAGYVIQQRSLRLDRPVRAYARWMQQIPQGYREAVLDEHVEEATSASQDPHCLGLLKDYRSLVSMAQEAHKPMFLLRPADGALGAHQAAAGAAWTEFERLARRIAERTGIALP